MKKLRTVAIYIALMLLVGLAYFGATMDDTDLPSVDREAFWLEVQSGEISRAEPHDTFWVVTRMNGTQFRANVSVYPEMSLGLQQAGVIVTLPAHSKRPEWFWPLLAFLVLFGVFFLIFRRFRGAQKNIMTLSKSTARLVATPPTTRFSDVGGAVEAKAWLMDVVKYLKAPQQFAAMGAKPPKGILLEGPPGVGKTLLARALAGEAGVPFFEVSGAEFIELFVGVGASRVRDLFEQARVKAPCVVFIDEVDGIGRRRGASDVAMVHQEREQALNQLLVSMDGFTPTQHVVVLAATNRADVLDPALLRPGRFDVRLQIALPDATTRGEILAFYGRGKSIGKDVDLQALANDTDGYTGADLEHLVNEATLLAARDGTTTEVRPQDFVAARTRRAHTSGLLDALDVVMVESAAQFTKPNGKAFVELRLRSSSVSDGANVVGGANVVRGEVLWASPALIKMQTNEGELLVARAHIESLKRLAGTTVADEESLRQSVPPAGTLSVG